MASDRRVSGIASALAFATLFAAASAAQAEPSSSDKETARTLMKEGDEKFASKDYAAALKAYLAAHEIVKVPTTSLAVAKAEIERGMLVEAHDMLLEVQRAPKEPGETALFMKARDEAAQLSPKIADRIPSLLITVEGPAAGAAVEVTIDGAPLAAAALGSPRKVNPGQHVVVAGAPGFKTETSTVNLKEAEQNKLALKLSPGASTPIVASSGTQVHIESPDKAGNVFVDGKAVGVTPLDVPVTAGSHHVEIQYPGGSTDDRDVLVGAGGTAKLVFNPSLMDELARHRRWVHWGFSVGPAMALDISAAGEPALYGGEASFVLNIGITPLFDFRTGVTAAGMYAGNANLNRLEVSAVVPLLLGINYSPWFTAFAGLEGGFRMYTIEVPTPALGSPQAGGTIGPKWSVLTVTSGANRQYELGFWQGFRFGSGQVPNEYYQSVAFTYLML